MVRNYSIQTLVITLLFISTFLLSNSVFALSKVTVTVDKNPVMINESILLTIVADDDINRNALDTSSLLADFIVGQTSVSSQTSMVNFKTSRMTKWQVVLIARKSGQFTIPALTIENQQSTPIELLVVEDNNTSSNIQADIFITSELSTNEVYVQQLLTLSIKLHYSIELKSGSLTEPHLDGANIEKIGQDKQSDNIINGKRYRVIEQTYAITPEKSGEFTLQAPVFSGEVLQASKRRSSFLSFAQTKPVSILGDELPLSVLAIPVNYPSNTQWLPTDILTLHQEWQSDDGQFRVGEPITRTITLTAAGLSKAQLPKLEMKSSRGLKIYPDQAEQHSNLTNDRLVSQKVQNFAIVPSAAGDFILPEMSITWFNTITNKIEQAILPSQSISVTAAENGDFAQPKTITNQGMNNQSSTKSTKAIAGSTNNSSSTTATVTYDNRYIWLLLSLWLLTCLAWFLHVIHLKKSVFPTKQSLQQASSISGSHYLTLLAACKKNNAEQTLSLILPWLKNLLNNKKSGLEVHNIAQAQAIVQNQSFSTALNELQQHLYGKSAVNGAPSWQGLVLLTAIQTVQKQQNAIDNDTRPLPLNP